MSHRPRFPFRSDLAVGLRVTAALVALLSLVLGPLASPARAWDAATTQAGLTEQALLASSFHKVLVQRLGRTMGAFELLALHSRLSPLAERQSLWSRLTALDPAGGYRPDGEGVTSALAWVTAGAVLAETPPERGRDHFFDPRSGRGLDDGSALRGAAHALRLTVGEGGSVRGLATGTVFDLTGKPALGWVRSPDNEFGLPAFQRHLAGAVAAVEPVQREAALVRALLALGGILAGLQDLGEPAHVRNDFRVAYLERSGSNFAHYVAEQYGKGGVPAPTQVVRRPSFAAFFSAPDGAGLADRTQRRFFSEGTVPADVSVDESSTPRDVLEAARASLLFPAPALERLDDLRSGQRRYLRLEGRRALGYQWIPGRVTFFLDEQVYADSARALLPEVAGYAAGLVDHLLRGSLVLTVANGELAVALDGISGGRAEGRLELFVEDAAGRRQPLAVPGGAPSFNAGPLFRVPVPAGARKVAAVLTGKDAAGDLVAVGETSTL